MTRATPIGSLCVTCCATWAALTAAPAAVRAADVPATPVADRAEGGWPSPGGALRLPEPGIALDGPTARPVDAPPAVTTGVPAPTTLTEFVALAEQNHPKIRAARAAVEAARGKAVQARLYPNPMLAAGSPQAAGAYSQWNGYATQDIVTAGKLRLSQQAALREVQKAEYELIRARFDVLRDVRQSFYTLLVAQRRMEIFKLLLDIAKRSYDIGRQLAEAGEGTTADVLFWSIERDRADVRLLNAGVFIDNGRRQLGTAICLPRTEDGRIEADRIAKKQNSVLK
ncbi:MAG: TolC family protein, partial [Planctomycetia bacterium]